jgi:alpha-1,3-fucosyltransferase
MLTTTYKFYLSFENSLCTDYVTEKLYRALNEYTIPIVFNGVKDMTMYSPPKSFINANDFNTPEDLVNYLKFLMSNPREYIKYFWWKKHYIPKTHPVFRYTHCDLCKKLNDKSFMTQKHQYGDIKSWFFDGACNQTARIKF